MILKHDLITVILLCKHFDKRASFFLEGGGGNFPLYIQYRHYNSFTQDMTHTILAFSDLDIYIYVLN